MLSVFVTHYCYDRKRLSPLQNAAAYQSCRIKNLLIVLLSTFFNFPWKITEPAASETLRQTHFQQKNCSKLFVDRKS